MSANPTTGAVDFAVRWVCFALTAILLVPSPVSTDADSQMRDLRPS